MMTINKLFSFVIFSYVNLYVTCVLLSLFYYLKRIITFNLSLGCVFLAKHINLWYCL